MEQLDDTQIKNIIETLLFITDTPLSCKKIAEILNVDDVEKIDKSIAELKQNYIDKESALQIINIAKGWQMSTKAEYAKWIRELYKNKLITKLTAASLETLAIIAYRQPVTRADIEHIRGVDVMAPLETLMEKGLIKITGKRDTAGRPLLYGVTERFLRQFGLKDSKDLPEFETLQTDDKKSVQQDLFKKPKDLENMPDDEISKDLNIENDVTNSSEEITNDNEIPSEATENHNRTPSKEITNEQGLNEESSNDETANAESSGEENPNRATPNEENSNEENLGQSDENSLEGNSPKNLG